MSASYHKISQLSAAFGSERTIAVRGRSDSTNSSINSARCAQPQQPQPHTQQQQLMYSWNPYDMQCAAVYLESSSTATASVSSAASSVDADFVAHPSSLRTSSLCGDVLDVEEGLATIAELRQEPKDSNILVRLNTMSSHAVDCVLKALTVNPGLVMELCEQARGNVVSHLIAAIGGDECSEIVSLVTENAIRLAFEQSGCVAVSRVYDAATASQQFVLAEAICAHFVQLSLDAFGNYVVQSLFKSDMPRRVSGIVEGHLSYRRTIASLTRSKAGSHVVENFIKCAPPSSVTRVIAAILDDEGLVQTLAFEPVGNYVLQAALRFACSARCEDGGRLCSKVRASIPDVAEGSPYNINICKAMGLRRRK